jgi:hypothetical protein
VTASSDFSPVVEKGELEEPSGLFRRLGRKHDLEPLGGGFARVLLDEHGATLAAGEQLTAGQKYWTRARSWVKVDVATHRLEYEVDFSDPSGSAGFTATIAVTASVRDAAGAARDGCTSAGEILVPLLREAIEVAAGSGAYPVEGDDPIAVLSSMRVQAREAARSLVGTEPPVPEWLSATVTAVTVDFDEETAKRHSDLIEKKHGTHLIAAEGENEQKRAETAMKVRDIVRNSLEPHLRDSMGREIEVVISNPTTENINAFASKMSDGELGRQQALFAVVQQLIDKDYLDKDDPIYRTLVQVSSKALEGLYESGPPALGGTTAPAEISAGEDDEDDEPESPAEDGTGRNDD